MDVKKLGEAECSWDADDGGPRLMLSGCPARQSATAGLAGSWATSSASQLGSALFDRVGFLPLTVQSVVVLSVELLPQLI